MSNTILPATPRGMFIVFEGGEGSGKTTQADMLWHALNQYGVPAFVTHEPGDTPVGMELRKMLLSGEHSPKTRKAQLLMFLADRAEHVETVIKPRLEEGMFVICDRYEASTMAYQAHAGGLNESVVNQFSQWASGGLEPNVTYLLDVDPYVGLERANFKNGKPDIYERKHIEFHHTVRRSFQHQYQTMQTPWVMLDATNNSVDELHRAIVTDFLNKYHGLKDPFKGFVTPPAKAMFFGKDNTGS